MCPYSYNMKSWGWYKEMCQVISYMFAFYVKKRLPVSVMSSLWLITNVALKRIRTIQCLEHLMIVQDRLSIYFIDIFSVSKQNVDKSFRLHTLFVMQQHSCGPQKVSLYKLCNKENIYICSQCLFGSCNVTLLKY